MATVQQGAYKVNRRVDFPLVGGSWDNKHRIKSIVIDATVVAN